MRGKLVLIGWDAADWQMIDPLIEAGQMPHLKRLIETGCGGPLRTLEPKLSPLLWTTIATGKTPADHGILHFVEPKPDASGIRISQSTSRKTKALWNILSQNGLTVNVIAWYASYPAEPVRGTIVSNLIYENCPSAVNADWPMVEEAVHPVEMTDMMARSRVHHKNLPLELLSFLLPKYREISSEDEKIRQLKKRMGYALTVEQAALVAMEHNSWDVTMVFFDAIDTMGHEFMQFRSPKMNHVSQKDADRFGSVMDQVYKWHDTALGRLMDAAGDDTTFIVVSDHGFHTGAQRPVTAHLPPERRMELESSWHRQYGIFVASGPLVEKGAVLGPLSLLDITPTVLSLLGIPPDHAMPGRVILEMFRHPVQQERIASWDQVEGEAGMHDEQTRQDPLLAATAIQNLIELGYLAAMPSDTAEQVQLVVRESQFNLGISLMSDEKYEEAKDLFKAIATSHPQIIRYSLCLAQCYVHIREFDKAELTLQEALIHAKNDVECLLLLAQVQAKAGRIEASLQTAQIWESSQLIRSEHKMALANVCLLQQRYTEARNIAGDVVSMQPDDILPNIIIAKATLYEGKMEEAAGFLLDAMEVSPAIPEAHYLLGVCLAWLQEYDDAILSFQYALELDKKNQLPACFLDLIHQLLKRDPSHLKVELPAHDQPLPEELSAPYGPIAFARNHHLPWLV